MGALRQKGARLVVHSARTSIALRVELFCGATWDEIADFDDALPHPRCRSRSGTAAPAEINPGPAGWSGPFIRGMQRSGGDALANP